MILFRDEMSGSFHSHTLDHKNKNRKAFQLPKDAAAPIALINFFLLPKLQGNRL